MSSTAVEAGVSPASLAVACLLANNFAADSDCSSTSAAIVDFLIETRSLPALARSYPRRFTFYLGNPFPRFLDSWFPD